MAIQATADEWEYLSIENLAGGLNTYQRPDLIELEQCLAVKNLNFRGGSVEIDTGYQQVAVLFHSMKLFYKFNRRDGSYENIVVTDTTVYKEGANQWLIIKTDVETTLSTTLSVLGDPVSTIPVASSTGFVVGAPLVIILDDSSQFQTTVASIDPSGPNTLGLTDAWNSAAYDDATSGNAVFQGVDLSGDVDSTVSAVTLESYDWMVFTNNTDTPKRYDGTDIVDVPGLISAFTTFKAKAVAVLANHLIFLNTEENSTRYSSRVRRSDTGDPSVWTTGNAGYDDIYDSDEDSSSSALSHIQNALRLGSNLIIYTSGSIVEMRFLGTSFKLFNFDTKVTIDGIIGPKAVASIVDFHVAVGSKAIYIYAGGNTISKIDKDVWKIFYGLGSGLNRATLGRVICEYIPQTDEIWVMAPYGDADFCDVVFKWNLRDQIWYYREFPIEFACLGLWSKSEFVTWNDLVGSWDDQAWIWNSAAAQPERTTLFLGPGLVGGGQINAYEYDFTNSTDAGVTVPFSIELKDITSPRMLILTDGVQLRGIGSGTLEYSLDKGGSWTTAGTFNLSVFSDVFIPFQITTKLIRFRISGTGTGAQLDSLVLKHKKISEW